MQAEAKTYNLCFLNMIRIHQLTFNPFAENTYLLESDDKQAIVIDPGMYGAAEESRFIDYIQANQLKVVGLWLTHAHLDHVFGLNFVCNTFQLKAQLHQDDDFIYANAVAIANQYGLYMEELEIPEYSLTDGQLIPFGNANIEVALTPGHSPGSVSFICHEEKWVIAGDVLFQGSIGRTDLPGGHYQTLIDSINTRLMPLDLDTIVYSGHGPQTTIGQEKVSNPFLNT